MSDTLLGITHLFHGEEIGILWVFSLLILSKDGIIIV
jgi:hypothetical protein